MDLSILLVQYRPDEGELRRTLASLLRQSCRDFELVVADDGSDEDFFPLTRKILAENGFTGAKFVKLTPNGGTVNCGNIIDAVAARLSGRDPDATSTNDGDGSFSDIEDRFNTKLGWGSDFQSAYDAVRAGGPGTIYAAHALDAVDQFLAEPPAISASGG